MTSLKNKVALITGSTSGLGKAIAERYASLGADIVINYPKDRASADEVLSNIKGSRANAIAVQADITRVAELTRMFEEVKRTFGKVDIVVANAGI